MSLEAKVMEAMKEAMKSKNEASLRGIRAIKAEIIKAKTEPGANGLLTEEVEMKMLQKMAKQRKESLDIFIKQGREDLAEIEKEELVIIESFLPKQLTKEELTPMIQKFLSDNSIIDTKDFGKAMGMVSKSFAGKADGKLLSELVKEILN